MKNAMFISLPAVVLLSPTICFAHGLNPFHYALGPLPICMALDSLVVGLVIPITVVIEALVLWPWLRKPGLMGNLWRASIFYIVARIAETVMFLTILFGPFFRWVAPGETRSAGEAFGALALCLIAGLLLKLAWFN